MANENYWFDRSRYAEVLERLRAPEIGVDLEALLEPWVSRCFVGVLPWPALLHLMDQFMIEGVRTPLQQPPSTTHNDLEEPP